MNHFHYIHRKTGIKVLGKIMILMGLIVLAIPFLLEVETATIRVLWVGGGAVVIGAIMASISEGTLIDFEAKKIKEYNSLLWIKFGSWENLPKIVHAELIHHTFTTNFAPNGITPTMNGPITVFKCVLAAEEKNFMVFEYGKEKEAIAALDEIRAGLKHS